LRELAIAVLVERHQRFGCGSHFIFGKDLIVI
jgi:hypothetical protein